ncbi:hypothetical protein [Halorussus marinus]|uniref:hypothetical protein n=1 Tax=Halorussus marinus TaxID=2505976 RepID=UPI00106E9BF5|nr:hypothetical protein [Halorussus marinus]
MGAFADAVRDRLRDGLEQRRPSLDWETERYLRRTPVDVAGRDATRFAAVEVEWRRADPVNNTAKLFYYAEDGELDAYDDVAVIQLFSGYYDLASGGVSSKREVAEFVGETAAESVERVSYRPVALPIEPPKRGGDRPEGWRDRIDETAREIASLL